MTLKGNYALPSLLSCQISLMVGAAQGFSAILLPQLLDPKSSEHITQSQASWIVSLGMICRPMGVLIEGIIVDKYGRKIAMQIVTFFFIISWLFTALSDSLTILYASRMFLSFTMGMVICVGLYIAEITSPEDRGTFLSLITPTINIGILLVYFLGYLFHWKIVACILAVYSIIIFFCLHYIPESHVWFMLKHRRTEAIAVLQKLRNDDLDVVQAELDEIRKRMYWYERNSNTSYFKNFTQPSAWKPFVILSIFSLLQQQAGYNIIIYYATIFFADMQSSIQNHYLLSILFAIISTFGSVLLLFIVHKYNRKSLLTFSGISMAVAIGTAAVVLSIPSLHEISWLPIISVFAYIFFCMLGMIDIPWMMIGELFPNYLRGIMSALITVVIFFFSFLNLKLYSFMRDWLGFAGNLWVFAAFSLVSVCFAKIFFPETKGKPLSEIEKYFEK